MDAFRRDRRFQQLLLAAFAISLVFLQMFSTFGVHITRLGFSAAVYGGIISFNGVLVVLFDLPLSTVTRRFPARRVIALGYLLVGAGFALNAFVSTVPALVLSMAVVTLGEMLMVPVAIAYVADLAPPHMRGRYMGAYGLVWAVALIVGPGLGLKLLALGPAALWLTCGALGLLAAAIISAEGRPRVAPAGLADQRT